MRALHGIVAAIAGALAVLAGALVLAAVFVLTLFDINSYKTWLTDQASTQLGREISIDGPISVRWGWTPQVTVEGLRIANTDWAEAPHLAEIERLQFGIRLWELWKGRTVFSNIELEAPDLFLQKNEAEANNWSFGDPTEGEAQPQPSDETDPESPVESATEEATVPDHRAEFPIIDQMTIKDGQFAFVDHSKQIELEGRINTAIGDGGEGQVDLEGEGKLEQEPFRIRLNAGSFALLRDSEKPYPIDLEISLGDTQATVQGTVTQPLDMTGLDLDLTLKGPSLDAIFPLSGLPLPPSPPYELSGALGHEGQIWRFRDFQGRMGDSDLAGTVEVDLGTEPLTFNMDLISDRLDFADLGGLVGAPVEEDPKPEEEIEGLISEREINLERLKAANGTARLRAKAVLAPDLPLDDVDAAFSLENGVLRAQPASIGVAKGRVDLWLSLYGDRSPVELDLLARVVDLHLKEAFRGSQFVQETGGLVDGRLEINGTGNSLQSILGSANGQSFIVMSDGVISNLLLELIGIDIAEALGIYLGDDDQPVPIRCVATEFSINEGVAETKLAVMDTADTMIEADGRADLGEETMEFSIAPHPHDPTVLSLRSKIIIEGSFESPDFAINPGSILQYLPPFDLGGAEAVECDKLIERAKSEQR